MIFVLSGNRRRLAFPSGIIVVHRCCKDSRIAFHFPQSSNYQQQQDKGLCFVIHLWKHEGRLEMVPVLTGLRVKVRFVGKRSKDGRCHYSVCNQHSLHDDTLMQKKLVCQFKENVI